MIGEETEHRRKEGKKGRVEQKDEAMLKDGPKRTTTNHKKKSGSNNFGM